MRDASRLPVVIPIREARDLTTTFPDAVCEVLAAVGVPAGAIADERARMSEVAFGRTRNRSLLGTMNDFASAARAQPLEPSRHGMDVLLQSL